MAVVACGRLEGQFTGCLIMILQIASRRRIKGIRLDLPQQWKDYEKLWCAAFRWIDELKPHHEDALTLMSDMVKYSEDRNIVYHALWREFRPGAPYTMDILRMKKTKKIPNGLEFFTAPLGIQHLWTLRDDANSLGNRLLHFGIILSELTVSLFGPLLPNARKL